MKKVCVLGWVDTSILRRGILRIRKPRTPRALTVMPQNSYCIFKIWSSLGWLKDWQLIVLRTRSLKDQKVLSALNEFSFVDPFFSLLF